MTDLQTLSFEGKEVRTVRKDGEMWWVLVDVCRILEIANSRNAAARLDEDEKDDVGFTDTIGRKQEMTVVNESGLYNVILRSNKPEAKTFRRWVTHEVLCPQKRAFVNYLPFSASPKNPLKLAE